MPYRSPARWLGPLALLGAAVAVYAVLASGDGSSDEPSSATTPARTTSTTKAAGRRGSERPRTYTVKRGDVLSAIAVETGVSVERLQRLNPGVDAQSLRVGQRLKLAP